jgi:hypothetical protein
LATFLTVQTGGATLALCSKAAARERRDPERSPLAVHFRETMRICSPLTVLGWNPFPCVRIHLSENYRAQVFVQREPAESRARGVGKSEPCICMCVAIDRSRTIISAMILGRRVTAQDVAWLRREVFSDGEVTREAADELFAVARARMMNAPEWTEFFVEMITDHVVWQARPTGVVSDAQAEWLVKRADECKTVEALAALVNVLAEAHRAPEWFVAAVKARASGGWPGVEEALRAAAG